MTTLSTYEIGLLRDSSVRATECRFWLFDAPTYTAMEDGIIAEPGDLATIQQPVALVSPRYSLLRPGETVTLWGGDSFERGGGGATGHLWELETGGGIISPSGAYCTVEPLTPGEVIRIRLTVTASNGQTGYTYCYVVASQYGWEVPTGTLTLNGKFGEAWSGSLTIAGQDVTGLGHGKLLLVHIDTYYDGVKRTIGGYKRPENLALLRVMDWRYDEDPITGAGVTTVDLGNAAEDLARYDYYWVPGETDGHDRGLIFENSAGVTFKYCGGGIGYRNGFTITDAVLYIITQSTASRHWNFTVFQDGNAFEVGATYDVGIAPVYTQVSDSMKSILCIMTVTATGSVMCIPTPDIRADEWYGTPSPRWPSNEGLTKETAINYKVLRREDDTDAVILKGYLPSGKPITVKAGAGGQRHVDPSGYIIPSEAVGGGWAADMLAMHNRDFDLEIELIGAGNALTTGDFTYVDFRPAWQSGHNPAVGQCYVVDIQHQFDLGGRTQRTTAGLSLIANWDA